MGPNIHGSETPTQVSRQLRLNQEMGLIKSLMQPSDEPLTGWCDSSGDVHDLVEHIFHHDMVLNVNEVVRADDRLECMVCQVQSGVSTKGVCPCRKERRVEIDSSRRDIVGPVIAVRDI